MKKLIIIASILFVGFSAMAQSYSLKNGGFETGNLIKGTKTVLEGDDWYFGNNQVSTVSTTNETKNKGKTSLKITAAASDITARYYVGIAKGLGIVPKLKYTLSFYAKSNIDVQLNSYYGGSVIKDGESKGVINPGDVITVLGTNKWEKYTLKLKGNLFSGGGVWDFSKPTILNFFLNKQILSEKLELYIDDIELLD